MSTDIPELLRKQQEAHPDLGDLYTALHTFSDRLIERYFTDVTMPQVCLSMNKARRTNLGMYMPRDGYTLAHTINLNIYTHRTGAEAAETLAHEMVHVWQAVDGHPANGRHGEDFASRMATMGIIVSGPKGLHVERTADWLNWMLENEDLELEKFVLPGVSQKARRQLNLFHCQCEGGNPVRSRKWLDITCNDCGCDYEYVPPSARRRSTAHPS